MTIAPLAIVTGAGKGIGKEIAFYFAKNNYTVVLIDWNETLLEYTRNELLKKYSNKISSFLLDVSDYNLVSQCITDVIATHQRIDILVNNAGIMFGGTSKTLPADFNSMLDVNLRGIYNMVQNVVPFMKARRSGYIFNLSSNAGKRPLSESGAYCMTKYGVLGYSQSLSLELLNDNIKVTAICPSVVDTDMTKDIPNFPNNNKISCGDIITTINFLLSLSPNAYIDEITVKSTHLLKSMPR